MSTSDEPASAMSCTLMKENYEAAKLGSLEVPDARWPTALADTHHWSAYAKETDQYKLKIHNKSHKLCSRRHDNEALIAIDLKVWSDGMSVENDLLKRSLLAGSCRILSICAENSVSPFGITEDNMFRILQKYSIPVTFVNIILAFGEKPGNGVAGMAQSAFRQRSESKFDVQYLLTYVELAEGAKESDIRYWTTRQVGLYQNYSRDNDSGFFVLLQPQKQSAVQSGVDHLKTSQEAQPKSCIKLLFDVHLIVLSSYLQNWQLYLTVLNSNFEAIAKMVLTIQWNDLRDYEHGQEQLQRLHYLRDRIFVISPRLRATLQIVKTLERLKGANILIKADSRSESAYYRQQFLYELRTFETLTKGFLESARSLEHRMEGILTMLSAALNLRDQATGVEISRGVLELTTEIVSDSTTVRVITFVTLVFMPATFIATVLGTNLFTYSASGSNAGFQVSPKFWIFVVLAVPLTLLTIGCWFFYSQRTVGLRLEKAENLKPSKLCMSSVRWLKRWIGNGLTSGRRLFQHKVAGSTKIESFADSSAALA